ERHREASAHRDSRSLLRLHHVNTFAYHDLLTVDFIAYPDAAIIDQLYLARLRNGAPITAVGTLTRFHIPFAAGAPLTRRVLADARARCRDAGREARHPLPLPRQLFRKPIQDLTWAPISPTFRPNSRAALITSRRPAVLGALPRSALFERV